MFLWQVVVSFQFFTNVLQLRLKKFNSADMVLPWEVLNLSPQTEVGLLRQTTILSTTTGSRGYVFVVSSCVLSNFPEYFTATSKNNHFIGPTMGTAKIQPTD